MQREHAAGVGGGLKWTTSSRPLREKRSDSWLTRVPADSFVFVLLSVLFPQARWDFKIHNGANVFAFQSPKVLQSLFFNDLCLFSLVHFPPRAPLQSSIFCWPDETAATVALLATPTVAVAA